MTPQRHLTPSGALWYFISRHAYDMINPTIRDRKIMIQKTCFSSVISSSIRIREVQS